MTTPTHTGTDTGAGAETVDARRERIRRAWSAAWDHGDVAALDALLSPAYRRRGAEGEAGLDLEEFKATIIATRTAFPDLATHVEDVVVEGERAAIRWRTTGTHQGSFLGVPPTRRPVDVSGATFARFGDDGLVVEERVTWDPRALLSALGIISVGADL